MRLKQSHKWLTVLLGVAVPFVANQVIHTHVQTSPSNIYIPTGGLVENDTGGKVPGTPRLTMEAMKRLYANMQIYRQRQGIRPAKMGDLLVDMVQHPHEYGFQDFRQANTFFHTPDAQYADSPAARSSPENYIPYLIPKTRPDGGEIGGPKPPGTHDVVATTDIYYHANIRRFQDHSAETHPVGFHVVLWADGIVEQVPFRRILYIPQGSGDFGYAYPGEAGVPASALTYDQFSRQIMRRAPATPIAPAASAARRFIGGSGRSLPVVLADQAAYLHQVVVTTNGIVYYFPMVSAGQPPYPRKIVTGSYSHLADTVGTLEEHNGLLSLEGTPYGRVAKGDHVQITSDKRVTVNGRQRLPN